MAAADSQAGRRGPAAAGHAARFLRAGKVRDLFALPDGRSLAVGYTEASRGCLHLCRHCPIPPIYGGRFFVIPVAAVVADVAQHDLAPGPTLGGLEDAAVPRRLELDRLAPGQPEREEPRSRNEQRAQEDRRDRPSGAGGARALEPIETERREEDQRRRRAPDQ